MDAFGLGALPKDLGATGFAAEDVDGLAAACAVTMNGPFGTAHTANGTGVTLATAPNSAQTGLAAAFLTPVVATNSDHTTSLAAAGAGGPNGTAAIVLALLQLATGTDITTPGILHSTGIAPYDTMNVIGCRNGICTALPDPGAHGLGAAAGP
jgi:gamma-glutamyltranspeptidase/glutathione hydrolase